MEAAQLTKEIHAAVDSADSVLLHYMPYDRQQAEALKAIGFTKSENYLDYQDHQTGNEHARYYRVKYPYYKFITQHQLDKIAKKYSLASGNINSFKGEIPEKNIYDMMRFRVSYGDLVDERRLQSFAESVFAEYYNTVFNTRGGLAGLSALPGQKFPDVEVSRPTVIVGRSFSKTYEATIEDHFTRQAEAREKQKAEARERKIKQDKERGSYLMSLEEIQQDRPNCLRITAPAELFDRPNIDLDPIFTVAVNGGFLIVTAWGPEASDPDVINPVMN